MFDDFDDDSPEPSAAPDSGKELKLRKPVCPYVCATPVDFEEELTFLAEKVYPQIVDFSLQRGAYFSPVDIRWKPDDKIIQNGQLLRLLLDYISKCVPFFICLLGECYGPYRNEGSKTLPKRVRNVPESSPPLDKNYMIAASAGYEWVLEESHQNCSLTELEIIQAAFLGDSEHCNFYFRQAEHLDYKFEGLTEQEKEVESLKFKEDSEHANLKIWDLKQRIVKKGLPVKYFKSLEELGNLVYDDWTNVVDMLYPPLENLANFIDTEEYSEWLSQESFAENLRQKFIPSTTTDVIVDQISEFAFSVMEEGGMENGVESFPKYRTYSASSFFRKKPEESSKKKSVLIVSGERGCGKSSVVSKWLKVFHEECPNIKVIHHFVGCSAHSTDISRFLLRCIRQLRHHFLTQDTWDEDTTMNFASPVSPSEDQPTNFRETCEAFVAAASLGPCVLVLDGIDELGTTLSLTTQEVKEFSWLPKVLPPRCRIIVTTTKFDLSFRTLSKRPDSQFLSVPSISSDSLKSTILQEYMKQHFSHVSKSCLQEIVQIKLSSRPLFLSVLSAEMQCYSVYIRLDEFIDNNMEVCSVREFWTRCLQRWTTEYSWWLESDEDDDDKKDFDYIGWVCDALSLLALSRNGLSRIEMMQLLRNMGYVDDLEVTQYDWLQFRSCLGSAVYDKADGLIDFSHRHLKEVVEYVVLRIIKSSAAGMSSKEDDDWSRKKKKIHSHLALYFNDQSLSQRKLQELPWQLMMAGDNEALLGFVTNLDYMLGMLDEQGKNPGNRYDLERYWSYLSHHGTVDAVHAYTQLLVKLGLLKSSLSNLQSVMLTEVPEDSAASLTSDPRTPTVPHTPILRYHEQLSVIEEGFSETDERSSIQSSELPDDTVSISDKGLVTSLAWNISQFLLDMGHGDIVEKILAGLIHYLNKNYPLTSPEILVMAECQETLGNIQHARDDVRHAESCYRRALRHVMDLLDLEEDDDLDHDRLYVLKARLLGHHGSLRLSEGELGEAEDLLKESLESLDVVSGRSTLRATILYHVGILRFKQSDFLRAESCLRQSLSMREQWFGKSHPLVADVLVALARLLSSTSYHKGCDKSQAEHLYSRAIYIREQCLHGNHLLTAEILYELGCLIGEQPSLSAKMESIKLLKKALDIRTTRLGGNHPETKAAQQYLTNQEVMLRMGHYEFGPAKPTDTRTPSSPYSSLTFRDKDLNVLQKRQRPFSKLRTHSVDGESVISTTRDEYLKHNRPLSIQGSSASMMSASERLYQDSDRPKLLRRESVERRFQQAFERGKTVALSESNTSSVTSDSSVRRLTVDLSFAGGTGDEEGLGDRDPSTLTGTDPQIDSYGPDIVVQPATPAKKSVRAKVDCRPISAPLRLYNRYGSSKNNNNRIKSGGSSSCMTVSSSSNFSNSSAHTHRSRCSIPGPHSISVSNSRSITGPHSSILSLLDNPGIPRDMKRTVHHKAAWYHVKGRYPTHDAPVPPKRSQSRPNSVISSVSKTSIRSAEKQPMQPVLRKSSVARSVLSDQSEQEVPKPEPKEEQSVVQARRAAINRSLMLNTTMVSFKPEALIVG